MKTGGNGEPGICQNNKFWVGIKRARGKGTNELDYKCCEAEYHEPQKGNNPLPDSFQDENGRFSFQ